MGLQYGKQVINGINIYQLIYINVLVPVMSHSVDRIRRGLPALAHWAEYDDIYNILVNTFLTYIC